MKKPKKAKDMQVVFDNLMELEHVLHSKDSRKILAKKIDEIFFNNSGKTKTSISGIKNTWNVLIISEAQKDKTKEKFVSKLFNQMLDDLHGDDFFGTEGQFDPRGDCRND